MNYKEFLISKIAFAPETGFEVSEDKVNPLLKPHQKDAVRWAVKGGRRAIRTPLRAGRRAGVLVGR